MSASYGTPHKVNNLLTQYTGNFGADASSSSPRRKRSRRSFQTMQNSFENLYVSGKCIGPTNCKFNENEERDLLFADRGKEKFLWSFLRFSYSPNQFILSWTGYYITIIDGIPVLKSSIQYLDCIDTPAAKMTTIYQGSEGFFLFFLWNLVLMHKSLITHLFLQTLHVKHLTLLQTFHKN